MARALALVLALALALACATAICTCHAAGGCIEHDPPLSASQLSGSQASLNALAKQRDAAGARERRAARAMSRG